MTAEQKSWLERLDAEYDNMRAALTWTSNTRSDMALRLAGALGRFWYVQGYWDEGRRWLAEILELAGVAMEPAQRAKAANAAASIAWLRGEWTSAHALADHALTLARAACDDHEAAAALNNLGDCPGQPRRPGRSEITVRGEFGDPAATGRQESHSRHAQQSGNSG